MARRMRQVFLSLAAGWFLLSGDVSAQEAEFVQARSVEAESETIQEGPIDSGYVILDGRYLPPPYTLEKRDDDLWINDQLAISEWFTRRNFGGPGSGGGGRGRGGRGPGKFPGGGFRPESASPGPEGRNGPPGGERGGGRFGDFRPGGRGNRADTSNSFLGSFALRHLATALRSNETIVGGEDICGCVLPADEAAIVVLALTSEESELEKLNLVLAESGNRMDEASCRRLIATFAPSDALLERMKPELEEARRIIEENDAAHRAAMATIFWSSKPVKYVVTLIAMGLVVAACGTLLNYRPKARTRWAEIDDSGDGIPIVARSVVLLILLGIFDLAATLIAQKAGGFVELNPLGDQLVGNPLLLTVFKMTSLLMACAILYTLRRYRGAQTAAWWMCLLCTVLTFRWLTYSSMFMS